MEIIKALIYGIIEGITEWLPVSSTGHLIIFENLVKLDMSPEFWSFFLVAIQLGAIMAVVIYFAPLYWPFIPGKFKERMDLWLKILVACIPAGVVGIAFGDLIDNYLYNYQVVAAMLVVFGIIFLYAESAPFKKKFLPQGPVTENLSDITYSQAVWVGLFQLIAAVFPGTSRSGATIVGGLMKGISRTTAAEFTFIMAIPVMAGASLLKMLQLTSAPTQGELWLLLAGSASAFVVSLLVIKALMRYIKTKDFKIFAWYRIGLAAVVVLYFVFLK